MKNDLKTYTKKVAVTVGIVLLGTLIVLERKLIVKGIATVISAISPLLVGIVIAFILNIPMKKVEKFLMKRTNGERKKWIRPVAVVSTYLGALLLIVIILSIIVPQLVDSITMLSNNIGKYLAAVIEVINNLLKNAGLDYQISTAMIDSDLLSGLKSIIESFIPLKDTQSFLDWLTSLDFGVVSDIGNSAVRIIGVIVDIFLAIVLSVYLLLSKETFKMQVKNVSRAFISERMYYIMNYIYHKVNTIFGDFITGQLTEMMILGSIFFVVLSIAGMPYALLISVLIGITSIIPYFGAAIALVFGAILIFADTSLTRMLVFIVLFEVVQQIENNFIYPNVVGSSVGLPPIWVLCAVTMFGSLFGVVGLLFGVPAMAVIQALIKEVVRYRLNEPESV